MEELNKNFEMFMNTNKGPKVTPSPLSSLKSKHKTKFQILPTSIPIPGPLQRRNNPPKHLHIPQFPKPQLPRKRLQRLSLLHYQIKKSR